MEKISTVQLGQSQISHPTYDHFLLRGAAGALRILTLKGVT